MRELIIVGAGGQGRELLDVVQAINNVQPTWRFVGFLDDGGGVAEQLARIDATVLGPVRDLAVHDAEYVLGVGDSEVRERMSQVAQAAGRRAAVLVHPTATVGADVIMRPGVVVCAGARVTTNVRLGRHTHLNVNAVVSHDSRLGDFVTVSPGSLVNGNAVLGDHVMLGTSSVITPGRTIGRRTWVGAGAVVVSDLPRDVVAIGVPARIRRTR